MKVILKADVKTLGKKGATVEVAAGYARNFLFPRDLAVEASSAALRSLAEDQEAVQRKQDRNRKAAQALKAKLDGKTVQIKARVGESGKLFGSITAKDVADAVSRLLGADFDKRNAELKEPIKALGNHEVVVRLGYDLSAKVTVLVEAE